MPNAEPIIPANPGWFAVYREGAMVSRYPVVAWVAKDEGYAVIVTEQDLVHTNTIAGDFLGFQHAEFMPDVGTVPNSMGFVRKNDA
jgi:hypothetical protein